MIIQILFEKVIRISGLRRDPLKSSYLARKSADDILRRFDRQTDDADASFAVGDTHPSDDIIRVFGDDVVKFVDGGSVFDNNADDGYSLLHI